MNRHHSESGVALITTLIMLALVTVMSVAFLALTRAEKGSVKNSERLSTSAQLAQHAFNSAQAEVVSRLIGGTNRHAYELLVSTNFINPNGFTAANTNLTGVSYNYSAGGGFLAPPDLIANVSRLFYLPRAPVFVDTNASGTSGPLEFRFYNDVDRSSTFEPSGLFTEYDNFNNNLGVTYHTGDPQWVGVLARPELPHAGDNPFVGRVAWMVTPAGKSLDLNWIHNQAKYFGPGFEGFVRNHGLLPSELNLAGFLAGLNTNVWRYTNDVFTTRYAYNTSFVPGNTSGGLAFSDAWALAYYRANSNYFSLSNISLLFGNVGTTALSGNLVDDYGDGSVDFLGNRFLMTQTSLPTILGNDDNVSGSIPPWFGSPKPRPFYDITSDMFRTGRAYAGLVSRLSSVMTSPGDYDRYSFYRLASQLGSDSQLDSTTYQIHLNYNNLTYGRFNLNVDVDGSTEVISVSNFTVREGQLIAFTEELLPGGFVSATGAMPSGILRQTTYRATNVVLSANGVSFKVTQDGANTVNLTAGAPNTYAFVYSLTAPFDGNRQTDFIPWEPTHFFSAVANTLLKQNHQLALDGWDSNILIYPTNQLTADVRRTLQVAANIYEATRGARYPEWNSTTTYPDAANNNNTFVLSSGIAYQAVGSPPPGTPPANLVGVSPGWDYLPVYPTVFRPKFANIGGNIYITGFQEETNAVFLQNPFRDIKDANERTLLATDDNVYGITPIIATRKGMPSFNEFTLETWATLTRKLEFYKNTTNGPIVATNQMLILNLTNRFGIEGWNSYTHAFPSNVSLFITNTFSTSIATNLLQSNIFAYPATNSILTDSHGSRFTNGVAWPVAPWNGLQFKLFLGGEPVMPSGQYVERYAFNAGQTNYFTNSTGPLGVGAFQRPSGFPIPNWYLNITNRFIYAAVQGPSLAAGHVLDMVTLDDANVTVDLTQALLNDTASAAGLPNMWLTNRSNNADITIATDGITNQIMVSLGIPRLSPILWQRYSAVNGTGNVDFQINKFRRFMGLTPYPPYNRARIPPTTNASAPFAPTRTYYQINRWAANDPAVHFTTSDLSKTVPDPSYIAYPPVRNYSSADYRQDARTGLYYSLPMLYRGASPYSPWGGRSDPTDPVRYTAYDSSYLNTTNAAFTNLFRPANQNEINTNFNLSIKDPLVRRADDWTFPDGKIGNIGWLGRVHRGTPWQTIYMKALAPSPQLWSDWAGANRGLSNPTNDWQLFNLFTVAPDANARRSLVSVNQTNEAAWTALLAGVLVLSNSTDYVFNPATTIPSYVDHQILPYNPGSADSYPIRTIYNAVMNLRASQTNRFPLNVFTNVGQILATPELSVGPSINAQRPGDVVSTPYLYLGAAVSTTNTPADWSPEQMYGISDVAYERLPQQIMSLLTLEDYPRMAIYAYGQALEPAERSRVLTPGAYYRLCTNYAIKGEVVTKSLLKFEGVNVPLNFDSTNNVDFANNRLLITGAAFRLRHTERNWGNIDGTPVLFAPESESGVATTLPAVRPFGSAIVGAPMIYGKTYYVHSHGTDWIRIADQNGLLELVNIGAPANVGRHAMTTVPRASIERYNILKPE